MKEDRFDSSWRARCTVRPCSVNEVTSLIRAHYLGKKPAIVLLCLEMREAEKQVGCVIYSAPPKEVEKRYGGKTWELARLYLLDEIPRNAETWLIAQSIRYIKRSRPDVKHLISYSDPAAGHSGTVYKASNWRADGMTDQERKTPRCDYVDERTGKKYGRKGNMPPDAVVVRVPRNSKMRFHYPLSEKAEMRMAS